MQPPRFRLRTLLIAVAALAMILGGYVQYLALRRRAAFYGERARKHAEMAEIWRAIAATEGEEAPIDVSPGEGLRSVRFPLRVVAAHEARLRRKYERAARYPWLPVPPDPPPTD